MKNKVSVLMTVYNTEKYLSRAIKSITNQTYQNFELIIVDDASTDSSRKILKKIRNKKISKYFFKKRMGRTKALNFALKQSSGDFIAILDSDDFSNKERLKESLNFFKKDAELMLISSRTKIINEEGKKLFIYPSKNEAKNYKNIIHYKNIFPFSTTLFKKKILNNIGIFSKEMNYAIDYEFILRVKKRYKIFITPKILGKNTLRKDSLTAKDNLAIGRIVDLIKILNFSRKNFNLSFKLKNKIFIRLLFVYLKFIGCILSLKY